MEKQDVNNEYYTIDLFQILRLLWKKAWVIVLSALIAGAIGFAYSAFWINPTYSSDIKLYVNNSSFSLGNTSFSISSSEITAAQSLVKTYGEILNSRSTLERVIEKSGISYSWEKLSKMVRYSLSNETEVMLVTVTTEDPYEAAAIANTIAEVLPERIAEIIDGASMEVVDTAIPILTKVAPSISKYTAVGLIIGLVLSVGVLCVISITDDTIHDEEYILNRYDYPILGKVPDLLNTGNKSYSYYYRKHPDVDEKERTGK